MLDISISNNHPRYGLKTVYKSVKPPSSVSTKKDIEVTSHYSICIVIKTLLSLWLWGLLYYIRYTPSGNLT